MTHQLSDPILQLLFGMKLEGAPGDEANRIQVDGASWQAGEDGRPALRIQRLEAVTLALQSGALSVQVGRLVLHQLTVRLQAGSGMPRIAQVQADKLELSDLRVEGPLAFSPQAERLWQAVQARRAAPPVADIAAGGAAAQEWLLEPLAAADGTVRSHITDAHLMFDAEVTVPVRQGRVDFNDASVEHVGPDSRMGVSRMGFYVDAPNGRSYLYQFASPPVAGVEFEQRGTLLGPWVSARGSVSLQPFAQALLHQGPPGRLGTGITEQARQLLGRTSLQGELQLGDGRLAAPGLQARTSGSGEGGRNAVRIKSQAVGSGLALEIAALALRDIRARCAGGSLACEAIDAALELQLPVQQPAQPAQLNFRLALPKATLAGLAWGPLAAAAAATSPGGPLSS